MLHRLRNWISNEFFYRTSHAITLTKIIKFYSVKRHYTLIPHMIPYHRQYRSNTQHNILMQSHKFQKQNRHNFIPFMALRLMLIRLIVKHMALESKKSLTFVCTSSAHLNTTSTLLTTCFDPVSKLKMKWQKLLLLLLFNISLFLIHVFHINLFSYLLCYKMCDFTSVRMPVATVSCLFCEKLGFRKGLSVLWSNYRCFYAFDARTK